MRRLVKGIAVLLISLIALDSRLVGDGLREGGEFKLRGDTERPLVPNNPAKIGPRLRYRDARLLDPLMGHKLPRPTLWRLETARPAPMRVMRSHAHWLDVWRRCRLIQRFPLNP